MVFSGIIQGRGVIESVSATFDPRPLSEGTTLSISHSLQSSSSISLGCSIAVNGVCLTVTSFDEKSFRVDLAPETLRLTNLSLMGVGQEVNLEMALAAGERNSGHYVQGHVDGMGLVERVEEDGGSVRVWIRDQEKPGNSWLNGIVHKGYVAVDGASLTVCSVDRKNGKFELMLIPHTRKILCPWKKGDFVNIEVDCLGKYLTSSAVGSGNREIISSDKYMTEFAVFLALCSLGVSMFNFWKLRSL